jgi:hypothetical protein
MSGRAGRDAISVSADPCKTESGGTESSRNQYIYTQVRTTTDVVAMITHSDHGRTRPRVAADQAPLSRKRWRRRVPDTTVRGVFDVFGFGVETPPRQPPPLVVNGEVLAV